MSETHTTDFADYFDLKVGVDAEGKVEITFTSTDPRSDSLVMDWETFREVIDFVCVHGLDMEAPMVVPFAQTKEADLA